MAKKGNAAGFGMGIIIGGVIGLVVGFLYAPRPGIETRTLIRERAKEVKDRSEEIIEEAKEKAKKIIDDTRGKSTELQEKLDEET